MNRTTLDASWCPIARSLAPLGDAWSLLILRDAFYGLTRYDEFEDSLGAASNILSARLKQLVEYGLLERHRYSERPPRYEYWLTARGRDARPVVLALLDWGNRHLAPEGTSVILVNTETGEQAHPVMIDEVSGRKLTDPVFQLAAGPAAPQAVHERLARRSGRGKSNEL